VQADIANGLAALWAKKSKVLNGQGKGIVEMSGMNNGAE
jgi:hypothetical protein